MESEAAPKLSSKKEQGLIKKMEGIEKEKNNKQSQTENEEMKEIEKKKSRSESDREIRLDKKGRD